MRIAILKETRHPKEKRTPLSPTQCKEIEKSFQGVSLIVESSRERCFKDEEYRSMGVEVVQNLPDADVYFGVKEVDSESLSPNKTYIFFSHTIKKQEHNLSMLAEILSKRIRLIDYERLLNSSDQRLLGFGIQAGIVIR